MKYILFIIGITLQLLIIFPSGFKNKQGDMLFWSSHGHDGMWHVAVANELQKHFPPQNPVFSNENLINYHFFSDIPLALINTLTGISKVQLYFQVLPLIYSILLGIVAYKVGIKLGNNKHAGYFSVLAVYFIGSFGYIVTLLKGNGVGGESLFWATQIQSSIGNPPQILSNIFFLLTILCLLKKNYKLIILFSVLASLSKIYAGIVLYPSLGILATYQILKRKEFKLLLATVVSFGITALIYLPFSKSSTSFLIFEPLWYGRRLLSDPSRIGVPNFDFIMQYYQSLSSIKSKAGFFIKYDLIGLMLLFIGNLGIRIIGLISIKKLFQEKNQILFFLISTCLISFTFPNIFLQKGVVTNSSQTFQYLLLVFGLFFALACSQIYQKLKTNISKLIFVLLILLFGLPTQIALLHQFYSRPAFAKISSQEIQALNFLKNNSEIKSVILTPPYDQYLDTHQNPPPIWDWFDTSYVAALTERQVYFADYEQVDIMGYDYQARKKFQLLIFDETNNDIILKILRQEKINLLYFPKLLKPKIDLSKYEQYKRIYENNEVEIWEVK